jgi:hypothetical protein
MSQTQRMARLLDAAFAYDAPTWRMGFDAHVKAWRKHISSECFAAYHASPAFAQAHDARIAEQRAQPMPDWRAWP